MGEANLIEAVHTLRSYNLAMVGMSNDPQSITSWITRYAENEGKAKNFCQDAAIGLLCHLGNPIYAYNTLTNDQQLWSSIFGSAEQALLEEQNWQNSQVSQHNQTAYARMFSTDIQWMRLYARSLQYPLDIPFEFFVNKVIADLRACQGSNGAGGIPHSPQTHSSMIPPMP
jgi:hypothetical protein